VRLSTLSVAAVLLLAPSALAQHSSGSAPSAPAAHASTTSSAPSHATSHVSSAPKAASPAASPHVSAPKAQQPSSGVGSQVPAPEPAPEAVIAEPRISGEERITSAPRIGEDPPKKDSDEKPSEPDLRRYCQAGRCEEPAPKPQPPPKRDPTPKPDQPESDFRRICPGGHCPCPPGQSAGKAGCGATVVASPETRCARGLVWNGHACAEAGSACLPGQIGNGQVGQVRSCSPDCSLARSRSETAISGLRSARQQRDEACRQDSSGALCTQMEGHYQIARSEYENLLGGVAAECRAALPDPDSL
jgi:hypothetical protein